MRLLERYILVQAGAAFSAALAVLTSVIWITQSLHQIDLLTSKGQTILIFLVLTGLTISSLLVVITPIALFVGILISLNKLGGDSELVVLNASGVSPGRLLRPFAALAVVVSLAVGALSAWALPRSFVLIDQIVMSVRADFLTRVVREGTFATLEDGFVFHYRQRGPGGSLRGVFIQDRRDPAHVSTYLAESGETVASAHHNFLVLDKGMIQRQAADSRDPATVTFERYAIDLSQFGPAANANRLKPRERSTIDLLRADPRDPAVRADRDAIRAELHNRLVNPLYTLALAAIGFAALGQARTTRQSRAAAIGVASLLVLLLRGAGFWAAALDERHAWAGALVFALPVLATAASLIVVFAPNGFGFLISKRFARAAPREATA